MRRTKPIFIVGGSGFIGTHLAQRLRKKYKVFATFHKNPISIPGVTFFPCDALDREWIKRLVYTIEPIVVIYAAGRNDPEWCESNPRDSDRIHASGAVNVCTVADIFQPRYIYLSNSYVFDGKRGNYREEDIVLPWTSLGKSKLNAENFVKGQSLNYVIVRSSPVFGRGNGKNLSFIDVLRVALGYEKKVDVLNNELHSFAPVRGLIDLIEKLVEGGPRNKVVHYGGLTKMTYYQFAKTFAKKFGFSDQNIVPIDLEHNAMTGILSYDFSLNSTQTIRNLNIDPFTMEEGLNLLEEELVPRTGRREIPRRLNEL